MARYEKLTPEMVYERLQEAAVGAEGNARTVIITPVLLIASDQRVLFKQPLDEPKRALPDSETSSSRKKVREVDPWSLSFNTTQRMLLRPKPRLEEVRFLGLWKDKRPSGEMKVIAPVVCPLEAPSTCTSNGPSESMQKSVYNYEWMTPEEIERIIISSTMPYARNSVLSEPQATILDFYLRSIDNVS